MHFRRPLMSSPKSEPQWGRLYVQEIEATWAAMIVPETESPPEPGRLQGIALLRGHRRGGKAAGAQAPGRGRIIALGGLVMAKPGDPSELVTLQELAVSNASEIAALVAVLERKGILT
jgi:hypothetical protein